MPDALSTLARIAPAIAMLAVFALLAGGVYLFGRDRQKAVLMFVCAAVIFANVLIWTL